MEEARAIAQLKGQIVDRMAQLDSAAYFWREKKCNYWALRIGKLSILTINCLRCLRNCVARMPTHPLSTFKKIYTINIKNNYFQLGTLKF